MLGQGAEDSSWQHGQARGSRRSSHWCALVCVRGLKGGKGTSASVSVKKCAWCGSSYSTSRMGYNGCCVGGVILLQIDIQRVRVFKLTKFKLTLCSIAKFELLIMQYEHNMKAYVYIQSNINRHIKQLHYKNKHSMKLHQVIQITVSHTTKYRHLKTSIYTDNLY